MAEPLLATPLETGTWLATPRGLHYFRDGAPRCACSTWRRHQAEEPEGDEEECRVCRYRLDKGLPGRRGAGRPRVVREGPLVSIVPKPSPIQREPEPEEPSISQQHAARAQALREMAELEPSRFQRVLILAEAKAEEIRAKGRTSGFKDWRNL